MYNSIAPSFFRKKTCVLPGIGSLNLVTHPAETDFTNCIIKAPRTEIVFEQNGNAGSPFNEFSALSQLIKASLEKSEEVVITGIGKLSRDYSGNINFSPAAIDPVFGQPVKAERVVRKDVEHSILVGDKETTSTEMVDYFTDETISTPDRWWIWAAALGTAGLAVIIFYLVQHGANGLGNVVGI